MPQSDDERRVDLATRLDHEDRRFDRSLSEGSPPLLAPAPSRRLPRPGDHIGPTRRPARPREYRRTGAWCALVIGVIMLAAGIIVPDGLLIAAGLVLSGIAVQLLDPNRDERPVK
ncbi:DUF3040 domain-containing protein [Streptomyces sp. KM77-8]|uniref:DUF3040 domain-containing protein n=1 Tax=Streptomyces haneummycinicus TaxID=3074435 RepID=A0AAT9HZB8_9ACTN